jgi:8-oxo-dGTP pyrophosphatase MutT (NUDIX family)
MSVAPLRPAATVVVLRRAASHPFDVLMVRRNDQVAFMAGAYVFPGGRIDDTDAPTPAGACDGLGLPGRYADMTAEDEGRARVAAIRELLEEAGVLLARRAGRWVDAETAATLRARLTADTPLVALLAGEGRSRTGSRPRSRSAASTRASCWRRCRPASTPPTMPAR